ncbi:MAG: Unknown protein [uncultured Sulfurovum sp.]|uniref:Uncharacterized protein n=1 Tax=uncultured Sulfurovum sp. TaxID=269237 RepID=A0A6S6T4H3_9BACT|nr:MAG: Unknown protein [uncultured Sulfurovum sp.]
MLFLSMLYAVTISTVVDSQTKLEWQNEAVNKTEKKLGGEMQ